MKKAFHENFEQALEGIRGTRTIKRLEVQLSALIESNLTKFRAKVPENMDSLESTDSSLFKETEKAEKLSEVLAKRWYDFIKISIVFLFIYTLTGLIKHMTTFILYHIYYGKICPLAARNSERFPNFILEYQPNICLSDFNIGLIIEGFLGIGLFSLFVFSSEWFRNIINFLLKHKRLSYRMNSHSKLNNWKKRCFQCISIIVIYHKEVSFAITAMFFINLWLSMGFCYAILKWFWACYDTKPPIYLSSVAIEPEKLYDIYRKPSVTISKNKCYATSLIVIFGLQIVQNLAGFLLLIWLSVNRELKNETIEFENILFRLRSYLAFKFRYRETYLLYLFAFK